MALSHISALVLPGAFLFQHLPRPPKYLKPMTSLLHIGRISLLLIHYHTETMDFSWHPMVIIGDSSHDRTSLNLKDLTVT